MGKTARDKCSFCGKKDVKLVSGPDVFICFECVDLCKEIADESRNSHKVKVDKPRGSDDIQTSYKEMYNAVTEALYDFVDDQTSSKKKKKKKKDKKKSN